MTGLFFHIFHHIGNVIITDELSIIFEMGRAQPLGIFAESMEKIDFAMSPAGLWVRFVKARKIGYQSWVNVNLLDVMFYCFFFGVWEFFCFFFFEAGKRFFCCYLRLAVLKPPSNMGIIRELDEGKLTIKVKTPTYLMITLW